MRKKELLYGEEGPYRPVSSSFPSIAIARGMSTRELAYSGTERRSTFIYVCPIDSLLYGARGKRRLRWTPDAEESEAAAGAAGAIARTEMDSGSKEREIRGGNVVEGGRMEEEGVCVMRRSEGEM